MTFEDLYTRGTVIVSDTSATNVTFMKALVNETYKNICGMFNWYFNEKSLERTSTANQQEDDDAKAELDPITHNLDGINGS